MIANRRCLAALLVAALAGSAGAQAPLPIVERATTRLDRTIRVALFSNQVAVVTIRSESEDFFHRTTLDSSEYMVYLQAIEGFAEGLGSEPVISDVSSGDDTIVLTVYVGSPAPRVLEYSPVSSLSLPAAKLAAIADDIQARVLAAPPGEAELRRWRPAVGDCVELRHGGEACVTVVADDGTVVLVDAETSIAITIAPEARAQIISAVLGAEP